MNINNLFTLSLITSALMLTGCGGSGEKKTEPKINQLPSIIVNDAITNEHTDVEIIATANDNDGTIANYKWEVTSDHVIELSGENTTKVTFTAPSVANTGDTVTLKLTVTDNDGGSANSNVSVTINNVNELPSLTLVESENNENTLVTIPAIATDTDGTIVDYKWEVTSNHALSLSGSDTTQVSFLAPSIEDTHEIIQLKLTITDNDGGLASDTVSVAINNVIPEVTLTDVSFDEKSIVSVNALVDSQTDTIVSYSWQKISGPDVNLTGSDTASISFNAPEVSEDTTIGLSLTVTDNDGDVTRKENTVTINQLTIPLKITGLATDSPISNGEISVNVAGRDITVDVTADESGEYTVDLLLDDSEADAFVSIIAKGVADQANAGLISLLGTVGQLSELAGEDNELTADEGFSVNVTNITTAQYALAKLANNGEEIETDAQLENLSQALNYDEVMALATAIKVAIDKAGDNADLALPDGITDTLALANNIDAAKAYIQEVQDEPEYQQAQDEILADENLIDTQSAFTAPDAYYFLPQATLYSGFIFRFDGNNGSKGNNLFSWTQANGVISAVVSSPDTSFGAEYREINGEQVNINAEYTDISYELKRLSTGEKSDVISLTTVRKIHFPNGELPDETSTNSVTHTAVKNTGTVAINHSGAGVAYLPFNPNISSFGSTGADEYILNADGTGHANIMNFDFTWQINNGALEFNIPVNTTGETYVSSWRQLTNNSGTNQFGRELANNSGDFVNQGAILSTSMTWNSASIAGIYSYDNSNFSDPLEHFWFELSENGDAVTKSSKDSNGDGILTEDEIWHMYGNWTVNSDGTLTISRIRHIDGHYTPECKSAATEGCILYHERVWRLIGQSNNKYDLFHKHDFKYSNFEWGGDDALYYDNRSVFKVDSAPVTPVRNVETSKQKVTTQFTLSERFSKLEPQK